jgi:hypothetical protein
MGQNSLKTLPVWAYQGTVASASMVPPHDAPRKLMAGHFCSIPCSFELPLGDEMVIPPWVLVEHTAHRTAQAQLTASAPAVVESREYRAGGQQHGERRKRCDFVSVVENTVR